MEPPPPPSPSPTCWSQVVRRDVPVKAEDPISSAVVGSCRSSNGISVAVLDANAIIHGDKLSASADRFVTVSEALDEVRDPVSRQRLAFLPIHVDTMEPSPESIKKVIKFARETGDLQTLSNVDLKVIALAYTLEAQIHGTAHLRDKPPPLRKVSVKNLPRTDMPGWGSNVPNLSEWEALENATEGEDSNKSSRILPLKDISSNALHANGTSVSAVGSSSAPAKGGGDVPKKHTVHSHPKKEINIEGKKMVADGIDASRGEYGENSDDWTPAVSRSTHRNYLRRKARQDMSGSQTFSEAYPEIGTDASIGEGCDLRSDVGSECFSDVVHESLKEHSYANFSECEEEKSCEVCGISTELGQMGLELESGKPHEAEHESCNLRTHEETDVSTVVGAACDDDDILFEEDEFEACTSELDHLDISSQISENVDTSQADENGSEQSWAVRSLSESSVACVTSDFAMQNVILQIGLRLLVPGGMQIRQLHRWVLKCHACNTVTAEVGRIFCPKCGNGGTLRKVSITVGENGIVLADRRPRISLRGTKFSIPLPQGGRDGITKNFVLREDQVPQKFLHRKAKKKNNGEDFFSADDFFTRIGDKKAPLKPPVGKAISVFIGRRNPNDNHFSRRKH